MQMISEEVKGYLANSSSIRKMFEAGLELQKKFGRENVYDFSLGNPDLSSPAEVKQALQEFAAHAEEPFALGYMPNAGFPAVREKIAEKVSREQNCSVSGKHVIMTCGAAGGINVFFRAILQKGDEVLTPAPYFVEYGFYVCHTGGKLIPCPSRDFTFELDVERLASSINEHTRAIIINSPHNPTGQIYSAKQYQLLAEAVNRAEERYGRAIFIVSDEPYRFLNFDNLEIPSAFRYFRHAVIIGSFSKSLSLAGERIGYIAVKPDMEGADELTNALILCNRILGFVNAPVIAQKLLLSCADAQVDLETYRRRRAAMAEILTNAGIRFTMPKGAFYFFPKSPVADEQLFIDALVEEHILAVPGTGFGGPGYFRLAFCVSEEIIRKAGPGMKRAVQKVLAKG